MKLSVIAFSEADFAQLGPSWQGCLEQSSSDHLFMSWSWLFTWWRIWSQSLGLELSLHGVITEEGYLVAIAPFYKRPIVLPMGQEVDRLYMLGNAWRVAPTVRTEYCSLIIDKRYRQEALPLLLQQLNEDGAEEILLCDMIDDDYGEFKAAMLDIDPHCEYVVRAKEEGVRIVAQGCFSDWLSGLGKHTRLKVYNRRSYINQHMSMRIDEAKGDADINDFFQQLNEFHLARWQQPCFDEQALLFHRQLAERFQPGYRPIYSRLYLDDKLVSLLYDIETPYGRYNLQSGYRVKFDSKLSLGTLHLGFAIESAFNQSQQGFYDLLAGGGKHEFYKRHFQGECIAFNTVLIARQPLLRHLYHCQCYFPAPMRSRINRMLGL